MPIAVELRARVEDAAPPGDRFTLLGLRPAVSPDCETVAERLIVPVNPDKLLRLRAVVPELPTCRVTEEGFDAIVKSPTPTVIVTVWESGELAAVTVTV